MTRIETEQDVAAGCAALAAAHPDFARALALCGPPPLRRWTPGFAGLLRIITGQLVSTRAAAAIWGRLQAAGLDVAEAASEPALRACGLSAAKARAAMAAARFDFGALESAPPEVARKALTELPGIGPWSADIYLMFCLGHADAFAPGDLALREAARLLFALEARPGPQALAARARGWSPHRAVAARLLWAYYAQRKRREGVAR